MNHFSISPFALLLLPTNLQSKNGFEIESIFLASSLLKIALFQKLSYTSFNGFDAYAWTDIYYFGLCKLPQPGIDCCFTIS